MDENSASFDQNSSDPKMDQGSSNSNKNLPSVSFFGLFSAADKIDYVLMFLGSFGACIHGAALPVFFVFFGHMIDSLGKLTHDPHKMSSKISQQALYLVYLGLVVFASAWAGVAFWMQTGERQTTRLRVKYLEAVLKKDMNFFDTQAADSNIVYHISSDAILVQDAIGDKTGHAMRYLSQFMVGFGIGFASVWQLTLLTLGVVPLIAIAGGAYTIIMSTFSHKSEAAYSEAAKVAEEAISQIRTVYSFVGEEKAIESYSNSLNNGVILGKKTGAAKGIGVGFTYGLLFCAWALLLWYASILVRHHHTSGAKAFTMIINVIFSGFALGQAAPNLAAIAKGRAAATNIISLIETDCSPCKEDGNKLPNLDGKIEFCNVSFSYPSRPGMVLENLSFSVSPGKTFAVVGPSGSGKSTIIAMLQRFYDANSGEILLDGHDVKSLELKWLREQMGLVSQEPALFATTIAENIRLGKEDASIDQVTQAASVANAHSFIQQLPDAYNTQVGEGGLQLSGGQKQRIAIARAVLRNPKILLLDEATSALDAESEFIVQQALEKIMLNRTTIVVAHRLSTIRDLDTIIVLKNGCVVETGNHSNLISKGGEYASLVSLQLPENVKNSNSIIEADGSGSFRDSFRSQKSWEAQLETEHKPLEKLVVTPSIWKLVKLNALEWPYALLGSLGAVLAGMEAPLFALGITHVLTSFYSTNATEMKREITRVSLIFIGLAVVTIPIYLLQHYSYTLMGERLTARVRLSLFSAILSNEIGWFDLEENNTGLLTSSLAGDATLVRSALVDRLSSIVQNLALTLTACVIAFTLSWRIAAVVVAFLPLLVGASIAEQLFLKGFGGDYQAYSRATTIAREALTNIRTVAAFGAEQSISIQFANELNKLNKQALLRGHISGFSYGFTQLFAFGSYALGLWYASVLITHKDSDFDHIMKSFMVLIITALAIAETLALTPDIVKGSQALGSVFSILHRKTMIEPDNPRSKMVTEMKGEIEFKNVKFSYPARPHVTIFENLNLRVVAGKSVAIVGQSGSGKSTVISLILRFYDPNFGMVLIDGCDIKDLNLKSLRRKIGLVQQEPALFSTSIYENIKYANEHATEIDIMRAAKAANAHGFISRMAEGYETNVGERGTQLSGGQKQRIAIARAILKDPSILLLDEATSALDTTSENQVQEAIDKLMEGRTTIVVAHKLSTIRQADSIVVLQQGSVAEIGSHEKLIGKPNSIYKQLLNLTKEEN